MQELLQYPSVIYDANCIVYLCFQFQDKDTLGRTVLISGPHTERAKRITAILIQNKKSVTTIRKAWDEAGKILAVKVLDQLIKEGYIQEKLKIQGTISPALKFRITRALAQEIATLKGRQWFLVDSGFAPPKERVAELDELYAGFCKDPAYHHRIPAYKGKPSETDFWLILFSGHSRHPLLTNDREIANLAPELRAHRFCELIKGFQTVRL